MSNQNPTNGRKIRPGGAPIPHQLPLWTGLQPISARDVAYWMLAVPKMRPTHRGAAAYIHDFNVFDKIMAAKGDPARWEAIKGAAYAEVESWFGPGLHPNASMVFAVSAYEQLLRQA